MNTTKNSSAGAKPAKPSLYPDVKGYMPKQQVAVGGVVLRSEPIEYNVGRRTVTVTVRNTGDRPIQVGSHFHFFEVNRYLESPAVWDGDALMPDGDFVITGRG